MNSKMKILRMRLRSVTALGILGALTVAFIYLPPAYRYSHFLISSNSPINPEEAELQQVRETGEKVTDLPPLPSGIEENPKPEGPRALNDQIPQEDLKEAAHTPAPSAADKVETILRATEPVEDHPLQDKTEHDSYVQDYPDYTPADFIEVKKTKPAAAAKQTQKKDTEEDKEKVAKKKPARLKNFQPVSSREEDSLKFSPGALRERALTFANNSSMRLFLEEQDRRVRHLTEECPGILPPSADLQNRGLGPPPGLAGLHNLLLDRVNKIAYCPVYKAASTTWSIILLEIGGYWKREIRRNQRLQTIVGQVFPKISNFAGPALTRGMTRFIVVRHPFERLLSCYRDKFEEASKTYYYIRYGEKMVRQFRKFPQHITSPQIGLLEEQVRAKVKAGVPVHLPGNPFAEPLGPTFDEFVQYVLNAKHDDEHWRTYYDHCSPCHMSYQFILRFEELNSEGSEFIEYLNRTSKVHMRWENPTQGGSTTNDVICSYYNKLTTEMIKGLVNKYERDFNLFEYKPDKYLKCASDFGEKIIETKTNSDG